MADNDPLGAPAAPPPPRTLGEMLRTARLAHDLTVEQLSTELRIEAKQLTALEENRFEQIGVPVFVKGYLKQYGQRLGVDVRDLLALYYKQTTLADVQVQPSRSIRLRDERQITSWIIAAIVLLLVVGGLAFWWLNGGSFGGLQLPLSTPPPAATTSAPAAAESAARPPPSQPIEQPAPASPRPVEASTEPAPAAETDAVASSTSVPADAFVAPSDDDEEPAVATPLEFVFNGESWAEVTDARGERLLFGLNAAGRRVTVRGEQPISIVLGNANAVQLTVDGQPYAIPTAGRQGDLARFTVDVVEE
jgi:cytoskeleton protein RodZ